MSTENTPYCARDTFLSAHSNALSGLRLLLSLLCCSVSVRAQLQQPFVLAVSPGPTPGILVFTRNDSTGVLTPVPGSPFPSREPVNVLALDFKGRFLFVGTSLNKIEMYSIDPNTAALQEVPHSPFASTHTSSPAFLFTESTGQFLYVINFNGSQPNVSSVESFQIDAMNLDLIPMPGGATDLPGLVVSAASHPSGKAFYAILNYPNASNPNPNEPYFAVFNSSNGTFTLPNVLPVSSTLGRSLAVDPQGLRLALGTANLVTTQDIHPDGTLGTNNLSVNLTGTPDSMTYDTLGQFLYLSFFNSSSPTNYEVRIYSPFSLQELPNSPLPFTFPPTSLWSVDPTAPLIYADQVYQVDPQTGIPSPILPASPISPPAIFALPPGSQPIVGPAASLSTTSFSFGSLTIGQTSSAQTLTISSIGGQPLSLNIVTIAGTNASDFSITGDTCRAPTVLQPGTSCSVLLSFTPSAAGPRSAALTIMDNAVPPKESATLSGTGLAPAPAVTLIPGSLNFGTVAQGTSSPLSISVTNSGNAVLHITSIALGAQTPTTTASPAPPARLHLPSTPVAPSPLPLHRSSSVSAMLACSFPTMLLIRHKPLLSAARVLPPHLPSLSLQPRSRFPTLPRERPAPRKR